MLAKEHKEVKDRLGILERNLAYLIENINYGFISVDSEWRYTYANKNAEKVERFKREDIIGKKMWEVFPNIVNLPFFKIYQEAMESGQSIEFEEYIDNKWYETNVYPNPNGLLIFYRDITERKMQEERKDEFIRMTSHELKTPITTLSLYGELLSNHIIDPEQRNLLDKMLEQAQTLNHLVSDLLDLSRIQVGKLTFKDEPFDVVTLIKNLAQMYETTMPHHHLKVQIEPGKSWVTGDSERVGQVIRNLIDNAHKFSPAGSDIELTVSNKDDQIWISVRDFGIGIPPALHEDIFERFYQITDNLGNTFPGLGLGLYLSKLIAEHHHGKIGVESKKDAGATFTLKLPLLNPRLHENN